MFLEALSQGSAVAQGSRGPGGNGPVGRLDVAVVVPEEVPVSEVSVSSVADELSPVLTMKQVSTSLSQSVRLKYCVEVVDGTPKCPRELVLSMSSSKTARREASC